MIKRLTTLFIAVLMIASGAFAQLEIDIKLDPGTEEIDDGVAIATVSGGSGNYDYYWTNTATERDSFVSRGLREGKEYDLTVTDVQTNEKKTVSFTVETQNFAEGINSAFNPVVDAIGSVLMYDPFAAIGLYDPVIYIEKSKVLIPGFSDDDVDKITVKKWLVEENERVMPGDTLANVTIDGNPKYLISSDTGKVERLYKEGEEISAKEMKASRFNKDVDVAAYVKFDQPKTLLEANGDAQSISIPLIVVWLVLGALFFTIRMGFINFRGLKHAFDLVRGRYDDPDDKGEVSHFQALTTALSGTVGLGNIAGVAVAITMGGPGATFWMILAGLLGMASKFVECTLGVKYREIGEDGTVFGGPMYYLSKGLKKKNLAGLGKTLAFLFAILCIGGSLGGGNMFQANQAFAQLQGTFPDELAGMGPYFGIIMAILVGIVIIGGIKSIAKVTDKIVPFMVGIYVAFAILIIALNIENIGAAFSTIFNGAFSSDALKGGVIGVLITGFQRAAFSNEAGVGSASIAHSAAKTKEPVSEGIVALMEPLIDTVVVCTMTALVLIFTGYADSPGGLEGAELTSAAFGDRFPWFSHVLTLAIVLFAFSTMISWSYYGVNAVQYLLGKNRWVEYGYKFIFCCFVIVGASSSLGAVIDFSDYMVLGMAFPNILGLILLSGEVRTDLKDYFGRIKSGAIKRFK